METSNYQILRMTGNEFKDICDLSRIEKTELYELFFISKGTYHNYVNLGDLPIPRNKDKNKDIETIIDKHPVLAEAKNKVIKSHESKEVQKSEGDGFSAMKLLHDTMSLLRESVKTNSEAILSIRDMFNEVKEDAKMHREIIRDQVSKGNMYFKEASRKTG